MYVVIYLDVDQTPSAHGPFADENSAVKKMADLVNEYLAETHAIGRPMPVNAYTDEIACDVTVQSLNHDYVSDLTGLPDACYRTVSEHTGGEMFDRFFVVNMVP